MSAAALDIVTADEMDEIKVTDVASLDSAIRRLSQDNEAIPNSSRPIKLSLRKGKFPPQFDDQLNSLLDSVVASKRSNITSVSLHPYLLKSLTFPATITRLCQVVGNIPSLETLEIVPGLPHIPLSVSHLALILRGAKRLETFICHWAILGGTTPEFEDFAATVQHHPTLHTVWFNSCSMVRRNRSPDCIGPFLESLRMLPKLRDLTLSCGMPPVLGGGDFATECASLAHLCGHPNLTKLTLQESLGIGHCLELTMAAIQNSPSLRSVSLDLDKPKERACLRIGQLIRGNPFLKHLSLSVNGVFLNNSSDGHLPHVIQALQANSTLTSLTIRSGGGRLTYQPGIRLQHAMLSMLDTANVTLTDIVLSPPPLPGTSDEFLGHVDYYLTLNRSGRRALLENPDAEPGQWVRALTKSAGNASALFYFLARNPALCEVHRKRKEPTADQEEETVEPPTKKRRME